MTRRLVLYEDRHWRALRPLTDALPVPALAFGASTLAGRWRRASGLPLLAIEARAAQQAAWRDAPPLEADGARRDDEVLVVNAAALPGPWLAAALDGRSPALFLGEGRVAGGRMPFEMIAPGLSRGEDFETVLLGLGCPGTTVDAEFLSYPWQLIERNAHAIVADLTDVRADVRGDVHRLACLEAPERITIAAGARIEAFAVLDARGGPIAIGEGARIAAHTVVMGPCVVGAHTELLGGVIGGSTLGPQCRIAGEVDACVWQGYANKRHHGFVGHSVIGEWVNLGALTTTSDLKNNYGHVRVHVDGAEVDSGSPKVGATVGAHVKTGIGSLLPTGAVVGVGANLFGGGAFAPRFTPAFGWWDGARFAEHRFEKFIVTGRIAAARRQHTLTPAEESLLRQVFDSTAAERRPMLAPAAS